MRATKAVTETILDRLIEHLSAKDVALGGQERTSLRKSCKLNGLCSATKRTTALLKERRAALMGAAVREENCGAYFATEELTCSSID